MGYYNNENYKLTFWDKYSFIVIIAIVVVIVTVFMTLAVFAGVEQLKQFKTFIETGTCDEIDQYLLEHIRDIGVGSGLSDLRADRYAQIEKLQELKCE